LRNINFSIRSVRFDYDGEIDTHKEKNFNDLIADLFSAGEIDNFQKLIFIFFHQVRNVFYHKGIPLEIEQPLKIPSSTNTLLKIYFNLVCDLIIKFAESLPFRAGNSHYKYQTAINELKFDEVRTNYFIPGVKIILKFLSNKWILLISMIEFITKVSSMPTTDMHFKWSEFFLKGGKKGKPYKFETQEKFQEDFKKFRPRFKLKNFVDIGNQIVSVHKLINSPDSDIDKISERLLNIHLFLKRFDDFILHEFGWAEMVVDEWIKTALEEEKLRK